MRLARLLDTKAFHDVVNSEPAAGDALVALREADYLLLEPHHRLALLQVLTTLALQSDLLRCAPLTVAVVS